MHKLRGVFCALWTPTDASGEVLWTELEKHVDFLIAAVPQYELHPAFISSEGESLRLFRAHQQRDCRRLD